MDRVDTGYIIADVNTKGPLNAALHICNFDLGLFLIFGGVLDVPVTTYTAEGINGLHVFLHYWPLK